ncbi:MAG: glutamate--tRNA ligase [Candidatus Magasanikbacteria bacterium CG10_big_fil_rev_8_21_14_0_10_36_32]|uniref:Glutamate--tRNA ligase n=1 Tax=Candidatus Magasanikbacteria bacterium CG10_big_fil_rev_8_21_14_0_10_36_32 TaxID=1974646 RepID=A0A2M6W7K8_9BACT|nr:MAG: glutamate--tRNA ligase [Candidatus Magasanikbacteria bacterium CG10_big_fil_rev_8_21_14_0_10_36_32]
MIKTRFAPSPTGYLHVGGLRTALYSYLVARQTGGKFLLRIEDTDRERFVADGTANILKSLYWAGLIPDEGVTQDEQGAIIQTGDKGPYIQSERLEIYRKYVDELIDKGYAYYCFCSPEKLEEMRMIQQKNKLPTGYDGCCRKIDCTEAKKRALNGESCVIRMNMPKDGETVFNDEIRGEIRIKNELIDDQVILKSDGFPTYHLAVVVDDYLMGITHIIRGEEWLSSVPKHLKLYEYFGWEAPKMAHLPLLLNADKSKLSKRQGDVAVEDYIKKGYLPEAILNFVAFLGWNPGDEREIFSLEDLIKEFSLDKVGKAGSVFNLEKLDWFNQQYLRKLPVEDLTERAKPFFKQAGVELKVEDKQLAKIISLERERVITLAELPEAVKFVFALPNYESTLPVWKKSDANEAKNILSELKEMLYNFSEHQWNIENLETTIGEWIKEKGYQNGNVLWPLRVSLSGQQNSPGPYEIADVLGKEESIRRIETAINKF